jgi:hypothetical protein
MIHTIQDYPFAQSSPNSHRTVNTQPSVKIWYTRSRIIPLDTACFVFEIISHIDAQNLFHIQISDRCRSSHKTLTFIIHSSSSYKYSYFLNHNSSTINIHIHNPQFFITWTFTFLIQSSSWYQYKSAVFHCIYIPNIRFLIVKTP